MPLLPRIVPSRGSVAVLRDQKKRLLVASLLDDPIAVHQGVITLDTPTKEFPLSNAIRVSEAGSFVWKSSSVENLAADIEHKIGFIGCEYVEEGRATKPEEGDRTKAAGEEHSEAVELQNEQLLEEKGRESRSEGSFSEPSRLDGSLPMPRRIRSSKWAIGSLRRGPILSRGLSNGLLIQCVPRLLGSSEGSTSAPSPIHLFPGTPFLLAFRLRECTSTAKRLNVEFSTKDGLSNYRNVI